MPDEPATSVGPVSAPGHGHSFADYRPRREANVVPILTDFIAPTSGALPHKPPEYRSFELLRLFIDHLRVG